MRVIAGLYRSRSLAAPHGFATRPTSDRLRETLFNVLAPRIEGSRFADLFAGSGAVGIEAISRGAADVTFVENAPAALATLRSNLALLRISTGFHIESRSVNAVLRTVARRAPAWDVIFLDPSYDDAEAYSTTLDLLGAEANTLLAPGGIAVVEHRRKANAAIQPSHGALTRYRLLEQGDAALSFFKLESEPQPR